MGYVIGACTIQKAHDTKIVQSFLAFALYQATPFDVQILFDWYIIMKHWMEKAGVSCPKLQRQDAHRLCCSACGHSMGILNSAHEAGKQAKHIATLHPIETVEECTRYLKVTRTTRHHSLGGSDFFPWSMQQTRGYDSVRIVCQGVLYRTDSMYKALCHLATEIFDALHKLLEGNHRYFFKKEEMETSRLWPTIMLRRALFLPFFERCCQPSKMFWE